MDEVEHVQYLMDEIGRLKRELDADVERYQKDNLLAASDVVEAVALTLEEAFQKLRPLHEQLQNQRTKRVRLAYASYRERRLR